MNRAGGLVALLTATGLAACGATSGGVAASMSAGSGCSTGPFGRGNWPPGCWRPYADASPFNTALPENPRLMDNSAQIVARVLGDIAAQHRAGNMHAPLDGTGGWPTYWANESDPSYSVRCIDFGGGCSIDGVPFHGPAGAVIQGGPQAPLDTDRHLTVIDQTTGWEYDLWQVQIGTLPDGGGSFDIGWGGHTRMDGSGVSEGSGQGTASHFGNIAGRVREEELAAGVINHAITIVIDCDSGTFVYPALASDQRCADITNAPPMGARFQLAMSHDEVEALPAPRWKKTVLHALVTYGMFMNDTGAATYFDWQTESGNQYTSMGDYADPWIQFARDNNWEYYAPDQTYVGAWRDTEDGMDWRGQVWSRLRVIHPCVSEGTCP